MEYSAIAESITWSQPDGACIDLLKTNLKTHEQTAKDSCGKSLAKRQGEENPESSEVQPISGHCLQKDLKLTFMKMCPITFEPLKTMSLSKYLCA